MNSSIMFLSLTLVTMSFIDCWWYRCKHKWRSVADSWWYTCHSRFVYKWCLLLTGLCRFHMNMICLPTYCIVLFSGDELRLDFNSNGFCALTVLRYCVFSWITMEHYHKSLTYIEFEIHVDVCRIYAIINGIGTHSVSFWHYKWL